jgi:hypothetical protein
MSPSVLLLVLYPVSGMAAPLVFYSLWPKKHLPVPNLAADAVTQTEKAATARLGALISLFIYGSLMCGTLLWQLSFSEELDKAGFFANSWLTSVLIGGYLGGGLNLVSGARCRNGADAARNPWANGPAQSSDCGLAGWSFSGRDVAGYSNRSSDDQQKLASFSDRCR